MNFTLPVLKEFFKMTELYHHSIYIGDYKIICLGLNGTVIIDILNYDVSTVQLVHKGDENKFYRASCAFLKEEEKRNSLEDYKIDYTIMNNNCEHFCEFVFETDKNLN